jgi:membrane protein YdbS with pleckstrin-like domain
MELSEPSQRLAPEARSLWRATGAGAAVLGAAIAAGLTMALSSWDGRPGFVLPLLWLLVALNAVSQVVLEPELRWRRWRYEIREHEIDIRHGVWTIRRTLVPMARVQHVDTQAGVLQQMFGLATVVFYTAAGETEIPQLEPHVAEDARRRIAAAARADTDV